MCSLKSGLDACHCCIQHVSGFGVAHLTVMNELERLSLRGWKPVHGDAQSSLKLLCLGARVRIWERTPMLACVAMWREDLDLRTLLLITNLVTEYRKGPWRNRRAAQEVTAVKQELLQRLLN
jgi:hypothetical protein